MRLNLPRTSQNRREPGFHKLLTFVDVNAPRGLQFRGQFLTPGAPFEPGDLPNPAVMIEFAGRVRATASACRRDAFRDVWVLWRFDFAAISWIEVVRSVTSTNDWTCDFAPIAHRLLYQPVESVSSAAERARLLSEHLTRILAAELGAVPREEQGFVLASLEQFVAIEIVRVTRDLSVHRKGMGLGPAYSSVGAHFGTHDANQLQPRPS